MPELEPVKATVWTSFCEPGLPFLSTDVLFCCSVDYPCGAVTPTIRGITALEKVAWWCDLNKLGLPFIQRGVVISATRDVDYP